MRGPWTSLIATGLLSIAAAGQTMHWNNPSGGWWNDAYCWTPNNVPDAPGESAVVPAEIGATTVQLNISPSIDWLSIDSSSAVFQLYDKTLTTSAGFTNAGSVRAYNGAATINGALTNLSSGTVLLRGYSAALNLAGPSVVNDGTIVVNVEQAWGAYLICTGNVTLSGTGTLQLNQPGADAQLNTASGCTLTQAAGHTISGMGQVNAALENAGYVHANISSRVLELRTNPKGNTGTLGASSGATLDIIGVAITQGDTGQVFADGGIVRLRGTSSVSGGTLASVNGGALYSFDGTNMLDAVTLAAGAWLGVRHDSPLHLAGPSISNYGTLVVNDDVSWAATVTIDNDLLLEGNGMLVLNSPGSTAQLNAVAGATLTNAAEHTVHGRGQINAALINNGLVQADVAGEGNNLRLQTEAKTNNGTMRAATSCYLDIAGITVTQSPAAQLLADGGIVRLRGTSSVSGGTLASVNGGALYSLDGTNTLDAVTLAAGTWFGVRHDSPLHLSGSSIENAGTIVVNDDVSWAATLTIDNDLLLHGAGAVVLNSPGSTAQLNTAAGVTLTQDAEHTIRGRGQLNAALVNNGLVQADVAGDANNLRLQSNAKINHGTMRAAPGCNLDVAGITLTQDPAAQVIADGGFVRLRGGVTFVGGTLASQNSGALYSLDNSNTLVDVTLPAGTWLGVRHSGPLHLAGSAIANDGTLVINYDQAWSATLTADNDLVLQGGGSIVLNHDGSNAQLNTAEGVTLTQAPGHTIHGRGQINAALVNAGTVVSDVAGKALELRTKAKTNSGLMQATGGAFLDLYGVAVTQSPAGQLLADGTGSQVRLRGGVTISGGTLASTNGGVLVSDAGANTLHEVTLSDGAWLGILGNTGPLNLTGAAFTNDGTVVVNYNQSWGSTLAVNENLTLQGSGVVVLNADAANAQLNTAAGVTLTQGAGHTIRGRGQVNAALVSGGEVIADVATKVLELRTNPKTNNGIMLATGGGKLQISVDIDGNGGWTADGGTVHFGSGVDALTSGPIASKNNGLVQLSNAVLTGSDLTMNATGQINVAGTISLSDDFDFAMTDESRMLWYTASTLTMNGSGGAGGCSSAFWATLEAGGYDFADGQVHAGNFDLPTLAIGADAVVALVDYRDNGNRNGPGGAAEALYVVALTLGSGATLNLNGLHLYVNGLPVSPGPYGGGEIIDEPVVRPGDVNLDGIVSFTDINPFVAVLTGANTDPDAICAADVNGNGVTGFDDINPFVALLSGM